MSRYSGRLNRCGARRLLMPKSRLPVDDFDLDNLRASGLTNSTILANALRTEGNALVFPYRHLDNNVNSFCRRRLHQPLIDEDGKQIRYLQQKDTPQRAYFPVGCPDKLCDGQSDIFITEGEKKALALAQLGLAAVGIGGIWNGFKKGTTDLIDDLAEIPWTDRLVYIVFDWDEKETTRRNSEAARSRLARVLKTAGAGEVYNVELPPGANGAKQGVDDFLVSHDEELFHQLVENAIPVIKIIPSGSNGSPGKPIPVIKIIPPILGEAAYHGPVGQFLRAVAPYTEATDAAILGHLLAALGVYIGSGPLAHGTKEPARVNTVIVGPTSTGRKGTSLTPVDELMRVVDEKFWKDQRVGGLSTGEGLVARVADIKRWNDETKAYDITPVEKRLYVVEEEFSKVLAQLRRDGNILSQVLRESYDSGNLSVMTRREPLQAFGAHIAITGHITPEELHDRFNHIEMANGFGNRFLWFAVKSDKVIARCEPIPTSIYREFATIFGRNNRTDRPPYKRAVVEGRVGVVPLATPAMERWEKEIYPYLREDRPGFAGALLARGPSLVLRVAFIYYLFDPPSTGESKGIQLTHLDAAMAVWNYCEESVQMLFKCRAGTFLGDKILELLAKGPMSKDELNDHLSPKQKSEALGVLAGLEQHGLVIKHMVKRDGAGRPATTWNLP
jgi:hypothetical protein